MKTNVKCKTNDEMQQKEHLLGLMAKHKMIPVPLSQEQGACVGLTHHDRYTSTLCTNPSVRLGLMIVRFANSLRYVASSDI